MPTEEPLARESFEEGGGDEEAFVRVERITKRFGRLLANDMVTLGFRLGEIHALLGENGAGKSTLIKILAGIYRPDSGKILVDGEPVAISKPADARHAGISVVHQRLELIPTLTVLENIALQQSGLARVDSQGLSKRIQEVAEELGFILNPRARVESLSVGARQRAEVVRALLGGGRLVILDEPTTILAPQESDALFALLIRLAKRGSAVLFVTHRLKEAVTHSDRITVLRQGRVVGRLESADEVSEEKLVHLMVGDVDPRIAHKPPPPEGALFALAIRNAGGVAPTGFVVEGIELVVRECEVVGIAGVEGNGQAELGALATGAWEPDRGQVLLLGKEMSSYAPHVRTKLIADIPEALNLACAPEMTLWENLALQSMLWERGSSPRMRPKLRRIAQERVDAFDIRTKTVETPVSMLSGGNQQRVIVARELAKTARVVVAGYPTRGLDVRSATQVKQWVRDLAQRGAGVVYISSDLEELFELSDRIAVISRGRIVGARETATTTIREIGHLMLRGEPDPSGGEA